MATSTTQALTQDEDLWNLFDDAGLGGTMNIISRVINFVGGIIVTLLGLRMILMLLGASPNNQLVNFVYDSSQPFVQPFLGILGSPAVGASRFEFATLIAIVIYALATALLSSMLSFGRRTTSY